jgi:hypothetical protein
MIVEITRFAGWWLWPLSGLAASGWQPGQAG